MSVSETDALIIGGGPAGLATALALRKKGFDVVVADGQRPPIDKACGEGLMPDALEALATLGVQLSGEPLAGIRFIRESASHQSTTAEARFYRCAGLGVRRTSLHLALVEAAERAGVKMFWETPATGLTDDGALLAGEPYSCRWLIGADGAQSLVRQWSGLDRPSYEKERYGFRVHYAVRPWSQFVEVYWADEFQVYVAPVAEDQVLVVLLCRRSNLRVADAIEAFPELSSSLAHAALASQERGALSARRKYWAVTQGKIALVGDAAGSVDAIAGEGLGLAFRQAAALADCIAQGNLDAYEATHRRIMRKTAFMGRILTLMDGRPELQERIIGALSRNPRVFSTLLQFHAGTGKAPASQLQAVAQ